MVEMNGIRVPFIPIEQIGNQAGISPKSPSTSFDSVFQQELEKIKFSNHALKRLENRNIQLGDADISKIQSAVERAELKGSKDSLVMMEDTAFIVNIPNRTVVTAMAVGSSYENIFTNIDSVVFV
ncbi:MAG: TIGR02530 family flagellar biosynthesis protein [Ignavibacteria bacterium]|nr:TIGR02530 family flagellar biosynthesis protein [Ignavibacteria bacterium]